MSLAPGNYHLKSGDTFCYVQYEEKAIHVSCYSWKGFDILYDILKESDDAYKKQYSNSIDVHISSDSSYDPNWICHKNLTKRRWDTLILDSNTETYLKDNLITWQRQKEFYLSLGIPYKRVYILAGVPGSGKSSLATTLASHLEKNMYKLDITSSHAWQLYSKVPSDSIIVIEDFDRYFSAIRDAKHPEKIIEWKPDFDLAKMMNALDGNSINDGCITIMTCNDLQKIPQVLRRPGRVDAIFNFGFIDVDCAQRYIKLFYPDLSDKEANKFATKWRGLDSELTIAKMQQHLFRFIDRPDAACETLEEDKISAFSSSSIMHFIFGK